MKTKQILLVAFTALGMAISTYAQQFKAGNNPTTIDASSVLEAESTTKGFLPPRMTTAQRDAIANPAKGLVLYNTTLDCLQINKGTAAVPTWECIGASAAPTVAVDCSTAGFNTGTYVSGISVGSATYTVTVTNNSFSSVSLTNNNSDLQITGVSGVSVASVSPATLNLNAAQSGTITYDLTGIPSATGTLTGTWNKLTLNCVKTKAVTNGDATFTLPQSKMVVSIGDGSADLQGFITNTSPNQIVINVPYTNGIGSYSAYTSSVVTSAAGQGGDLNGFTISYPAGSFSTSGTIPVTVTVDGDGSYLAKKQLVGVEADIATIPFLSNGNNKGNILLRVIGGIPDRAFGQTINGANNHNFIYLPVTGSDGRTWLNNNLGAHYSNMNHASFNPGQQATSQTDYLAYGSQFQWGRKPDGHELVTYTNGTTASPVNGVTATRSDNPSDALFITGFPFPHDWRINQDDNIWATEASANNPCPVGYRVPTLSEINALGFNNIATAFSSTLKIPLSGYRNSDSSFAIVGVTGFIFSSTPVTTSAYAKSYDAGGNGNAGWHRAGASPVRCIKN